MPKLALILAVVALSPVARAAEDGAALFASKCAACHGKDAKGGKIAKDAIAGKEEATVKKMILEGGGKMKPVKSLDDAQAASVAKYVHSLK
jgi:mono/diheme cytochrome c family protein